MIRQLFLSGCLLISLNIFGQSLKYAKIDENSKSYIDSTYSYTSIATHLTSGLKENHEKVRAIYRWITHNIRYDLSQLGNDKVDDSKDNSLYSVLKTKKGVCAHYAELFLEMSQFVGLDSYNISGYTKDEYGVIANYSHAWNAVKLDGNFYLLDLTWDSGFVRNGKYIHKFREDYYLMPPQEFIKDHMPFDPIWQFLNNPINNADFLENNYLKLNVKGNYAYQDSIKIFESLDKLHQLQASNRRIIEMQVNNKLVLETVNNNLYNIGTTKYNIANKYHNKGVMNYNKYVLYRNKRFRKPKIADSTVLELITTAKADMEKANELYNAIRQKQDEFKNDDLILSLNETLISVQDNLRFLNKEKKFIDRYLKTWKPFRIFLF